MTVHENMSFGLRLKKVPKAEIERRVKAVAGILGITELLNRKPKQLSGGQRQRVAMGRAIVRNPKVFLFDEPLSNLDAKLRVHMRTEIKKVHQKVRTTTVYVTHEQAGAPNDLYHSPATLFVAGFIGSPAMNITGCALEEAAGALRVRLNGGASFPVPAERTARYRAYAGQRRLLFGLRPEHLTEMRPHSVANQCPFEVTPEVTEPLGMETLVFFSVNGTDMCARTNPAANTQPGVRTQLLADLNHMHLIDEASGRVL